MHLFIYVCADETKSQKLNQGVVTYNVERLVSYRRTLTHQAGIKWENKYSLNK